MQVAHNRSCGAPGLVLDTNVWLDLLLFEDARVLPLRSLVETARVELLIAERTRAEWRRVLHYPQLALDDAKREALMAAYDALARVVGDDGSPASAATAPALPRCRDPDDQVFLELAAGSHASALLSRDRALLALDRRCRRVAGFAVRHPADWLAAFVAAMA